MSLESLQKRLNDPQPQAVPGEAVPVVEAATVAVTAGELREAAAAQPGHPVAGVFLRAVEGFPADHEVVAEKVDVEALLANREVIRERTVRHGRPVIVKRLGGSLSSPAPLPEPPAE